MVGTPKRRGNKIIKKIKTNEEVIATPTSKVPEQQIVVARNFYNMGMDAKFTAKQPGTPGQDTCQKLWRFWDNELRKEYEIDTNERQINVKQRLNESFKRLLFKLEIQLQKYETALDSAWNAWQFMVKKKQADGDENIPAFEIDTKVEMDKLKVIQTIIETRDAMAAMELTPTINEQDELAVLKRLQEKADRQASI